MPDKTVSTQSFATAAKTEYTGKKLRVAVIGCGGIGEKHIGLMKDMPEIELIAACDLKHSRLKLMEDGYGISGLYTDWKELLKIERPDAVNICTPNAVHAAPTIDAANAGCHIIVEKPMAMSPAQCQKMIDAARKNKVKLCVGFQYRFHPATDFLLRARDEGQFGKIMFVKCQALRRRGIPNWGVFGQKHLQGGGPMIDIGVHVIEMAHYLMGSPKPVAAAGNTWTYMGNKKSNVASQWPNWDFKTYTVEDLAIGQIRFENDAIMQIEASFAAHIKEDTWNFTVVGDKGGCTWDPPTIFTDRAGTMVNESPAFIGTNTDFTSLFVLKLRNWVDACLHNAPLRATGEAGLAVQKILDGVYRAADAGKEVAIKQPSCDVETATAEILKPQVKTKNLRAEYLAIGAFAICSIAAAITSKGFLEADGCTHYLFARHAFEQPVYLVDVWGRPLCAALFAIPAHLAGLIGVRVVSLLLAIACALVARTIAVGQNYRWPTLALLFTLGQPLLFLHSFAELTELPFALVMGLTLLAYHRQKWGWLAILAAIAPLGRPEGFALLLPVAAALMLHRRFLWLLVLPLGLILWSIAGHAITGPADAPAWRWLIDHWPYGQHSEYARGSLVHFLILLPMIVGPFALPAMWLAMGRNLAGIRHLDRLTEDHHARVDVLIALIPLSILIGHSILYWGGWLSSNGELRYLLIAAPMWGLLSARGWEWIFERMNWRHPLAWAALAIVAPGLVNYYWRVLPLSESADWQTARQFAQWYTSSQIRNDDPKILCNHPAVFYFLDQSPLDETHSAPWSADSIDHPTPGVMLVWDPIYSVFNADPRAVMKLSRIQAAGWILDSRAECAANVNGMIGASDFSQQWHIFISPSDSTHKNK